MCYVYMCILLSHWHAVRHLDVVCVYSFVCVYAYYTLYVFIILLYVCIYI
jgi:hypothetical protein